MPDYKVIVRDTSGDKQAVITDFLTLSYSRRVNAQGIASIAVPGEHSILGSLAHRWQVEIHRRDQQNGVDWYCDFNGLFLDPEHRYTDRPLFKMNCPGQMWLLSTRDVMWTAGTADRTAFSGVAAETIMKALVDYNAGSNATTGNGRVRDGAITGISVEADGGGGNSLDWFCAWKNLLKELQKIAQVGGGDFDLVKTGGASWEFRWYAGQRGTDLSSNVIFALDRGNMANPRYRYNRRNERTVAVVGGRGEEASRDISVVTGPDYSASNDVEVFVDARNTDSADGRTAAGNRKLDDLRAREEVAFDVLQVPGCLYGKDYCVEGVLGDLVTAKYITSTTQKIIGVTVAVNDSGNESIDVEMETQ